MLHLGVERLHTNKTRCERLTQGNLINKSPSLKSFSSNLDSVDADNGKAAVKCLPVRQNRSQILFDIAAECNGFWKLPENSQYSVNNDECATAPVADAHCARDTGKFACAMAEFITNSEMMHFSFICSFRT